MTVSKGGKYRVVDKVGDWYAVELNGPLARVNTGWVNAADVSPIKMAAGIDVPVNSPAAPSTAAVYDVIVQKASQLKEKYRNNPYLSVTGFTVNVGIPPSVGMNFEFRK
ncbi:SH3 domain-containing protein [Paraburkholderia strydomiana]|uniref:hypothetical protein n=1 Tax=Paraburkholderia strydomiana TaxID=1245417 RepID=UPI00285C5283|nr:hypothetical protein [Paraburkholderia strydomiana]MDR7009601.1 hypothetical protein [Paraburkholderia strydomiana]